ncbi:MAG: hypothetical protein N3D11_08440 [Candidatus Sumerlaeia bacterium]|nr:hypothetical protein [Candidatus Sumerlaeia bacterium]
MSPLKSFLTLTVAFLLVTVPLPAAKRDKGAEAKGQKTVLKEAAREIKKGGGSAAAAFALVAKCVAKEVGLASDKVEPFASAYAAEREAAAKQLLEIRKSGDRDKAKQAQAETEKKMDKVLADHLSADQVKKAKEMDLAGLDRSAMALLSARVEPAKVEQAMPVLLKYHKAAAELMAKAKSRAIDKTEALNKNEELRKTTAKDLAAIVGEEAAQRWQGASGSGKTKPAGETTAKPTERSGRVRKGDAAKP